jgi:hypothetical protein
MKKVIAPALFALTSLAGCSSGSHGPYIPIWDNPLDVRNCRRIDRVSGVVSTQGGFAETVTQMQADTLASGGSDLLLRKGAHDWSLVVGEAYLCHRTGPVTQKVLAVKY